MDQEQQSLNYKMRKEEDFKFLSSYSFSISGQSIRRYITHGEKKQARKSAKASDSSAYLPLICLLLLPLFPISTLKPLHLPVRLHLPLRYDFISSSLSCYSLLLPWRTLLVSRSCFHASPLPPPPLSPRLNRSIVSPSPSGPVFHRVTDGLNGAIPPSILSDPPLSSHPSHSLDLSVSPSVVIYYS